MTEEKIPPEIAVTGSTGYVGGRLVPLLLDAGFRVRCIAREPRKLDDRHWRRDPRASVVRSDLSNAESLAPLLEGCDAAYYLVHSMESSGKDYADRDRKLADVFARAASQARVSRIVYLGGLGSLSASLSEHLSSRREVERILGTTGIPVTVFRAAMIIGSGSASFEILRYLVERLPIMITPSWVKTESQPISIKDVLHWLVRCLSVPETSGRILEIGGPDVLPYRELMRIMAEELGLRRRIVIPLPMLTPRLSSGWISLVTPVSYRIARPLAEGLRNRVVVTNEDVQRLMPHQAIGVRDAIRLALAKVRANDVATRWSVAGPIPGDPNWAGGAVFTDERSILVFARAEKVFQAVTRIGGGHGWYAGDMLWRIRGWMDTLAGGPGLRRGRRDPDRVEFGEALDFWRVIGLERNRSLSLLAEMKLPGIATLDFSLSPGAVEGPTKLTMTARFRSKGSLGVLYWYSVLPLHNVVFGGMLKGIKRIAESSRGHRPDTLQPADAPKPGYGRARLWLGICAVGTIVTASALALALEIPRKAAAIVDPSLSGQLLLLASFFVMYAAIHVPFDVLGGYLLPRRFGREHLSASRFASTLLRGMVMHSLLLALIGLCIFMAARPFGILGAITAGVLASFALLVIRGPLSRCVASLRPTVSKCEPIDLRGTGLRAARVASEDQGFTGGIEGVFRPRRVIFPERWTTVLGAAAFEVVRQRQQLAVLTGSWFRGRVLALGFTWTGIAISAVLVGRDHIGSAQGVIEMSLIFTLWSFVGLLLLPTPSRAGVAEVDGAVRQSGIDGPLVDETIRKLDTLQDAETERPTGVELIFHPIPSVDSRIEGPTSRNIRGFLGAARTAVYLSAAGLGLLGRAVHCNCGRPALWVFLPSD